MNARPTPFAWSNAAHLADEALIGEVLLASLPEVAAQDGARRDRLLEALRTRYEEDMRAEVARARYDFLRDAAAVADFLDYAWDQRRFLSCLRSWHGAAARGPFRPYLQQKTRWLILCYYRHRKRRGGPTRELKTEPALAPPSAEKALSEALLAAARLCAEKVPLHYRAPWKLQHVTLVDLDERDLAHLASRTRRTVESIRARLAALLPKPGRRLPLVEIADLTGIAVASVGTYVARAARLVEECVNRRVPREDPS